MTVLVIFTAIFFLLIFLLYFNRSSKKMPENVKEIKIEGWYQFYGYLGFFEDFVLKFCYKVGE
jgi:hypothetical protein